jgi:hypothetical protein
MAHLPSLPLSRRSLRRALGALWLADAALQAQPVIFGADWWRSDLAQSAMGEPPAIAHSIFWAVDLVAQHAAAWNVLFVAIQALIGLALLTGRGARAAIVASVPWAIGIWWVGEGLGLLPTGFALLAAGAPGPVLLYPMLGFLAWPGRDGEDRVPPRAAPALWAGLWAGLTLLQVPWVYPARQVLTANLEELSQGLPSWQASTASWLGRLASAHPVGLSAGMAAVQVAVGLAVLWPRARRPALAVALVVLAAYWVGFQYLGGVTAPGATDPGTAPLMALLALALWPAPVRRLSESAVVARPAGVLPRRSPSPA